jgi:uncharacterized protein YgiM (DUF1202 family)
MNARLSRREKWGIVGGVMTSKGAALIAAALLCPLFLLGCGRSGGAERVNLPATPVLSIRSTWAVVKSPLLRVRQEPSNQSMVLSHVRMGSLVEVLTKSDKEDTVENETAWWYRVDYQGLKGWVFSSYIEIFDSRSKAEQYAARLR